MGSRLFVGGRVREYESWYGFNMLYYPASLRWADMAKIVLAGVYSAEVGPIDQYRRC